jgi:hypothetical protein
VARFCAEPCCNGIAHTGKFCATHAEDNYVVRRLKAAEEHRYSPRTRRWYSLAAWRSRKRGLRAWQLMMEPVCQVCFRYAAKDVHHIDGSWRESENWMLFIDRKNLMSLCHECHSKITAKESLCQQ